METPCERCLRARLLHHRLAPSFLRAPQTLTRPGDAGSGARRGSTQSVCSRLFTSDCTTHEVRTVIKRRRTKGARKHNV